MLNKNPDVQCKALRVLKPHVYKIVKPWECHTFNLYSFKFSVDSKSRCAFLKQSDFDVKTVESVDLNGGFSMLI